MWFIPVLMLLLGGFCGFVVGFSYGQDSRD